MLEKVATESYSPGVSHVPPLPAPLREQVDAAARSISERGAVRLAELLKTHRPEDEARFVEALAQRGVQRVGQKQHTKLRAPVEEQLRRLLTGGEPVAKSAVIKQVKAAPRSEIDHALAGMLAAGELVLLKPSRSELLALASEDYRKPDAALLELLEAMKKAVGAARKSPARSLDVRPLRALARAAGLAERDPREAPAANIPRPERLGSDGPADAASSHRVDTNSTESGFAVGPAMDQALAERRAQLLVNVPELIRAALGARISNLALVAAAKEHLKGLEDRGTIELRIEAGMGGLSSTDRALCLESGELVLSTLRQLSTGAGR